MEQCPLISLVIPVYNVEKYFDKCMESALAQTYDNYEVILVDDGSTDSSGRMCDVYAEKDDRVTVYHKANGGLSDARNFGVNKANGEWISFLDSDDFLAPDYLQYLYSLIEKYDADMASSGFFSVYDNAIVGSINKPVEEIAVDTEEALKRICYGSVGAPCRIYKKKILLKHPYPIGRLYEDLATTYRLVGECKTIVFSNKMTYYWVVRDGSIMHSEIDEKSYDVFDAAIGQINYVDERYPKIKMAPINRLAQATAAFTDSLFSCSSEQEQIHFFRARQYLVPYIKSLLLDKETKLRLKLSCFAILLGYWPAKLFWKVKSALKSRMGRTAIGQG